MVSSLCNSFVVLSVIVFFNIITICVTEGTVLDLPYRFTADGDVMERAKRFNFDSMMLEEPIDCCCILQ